MKRENIVFYSFFLFVSVLLIINLINFESFYEIFLISLLFIVLISLITQKLGYTGFNRMMKSMPFKILTKSLIILYAFFGQMWFLIAFVVSVRVFLFSLKKYKLKKMEVAFYEEK